ncbi:hypothetical protein AVEN_53329-1 [Araneus ventricosus]|uniref:Uncharacterized protein n=1 Tax=Araneus ventricosus TaxID=182803 RepID=A0A4Y2AB91_ARAVE|nr:hypothetical protein AVEN_53329-1 [Araneus ventricosus]
MNQLKRGATNEGRTNSHSSVGWERYHPSCSAYFQCNAQNADNPSHPVVKFNMTCSVADASRSGRPKTAKNEGKSTQLLAAMARSLTKGTRRLSAQMGISQSSVMRNLLANKWHPYKLQMLQHLT